MNRRIVSMAITSALAVCLAPALAGAQDIASKQVEVKVVKVAEHYSEITRFIPEEKCYKVAVNDRRGDTSSHTPELVGAVLGGAIGNEINNSDISKIAGALLGASIASDLEKQNAKSKGGSARTEVRCEIVEREVTSTELDGYRVTFEYDGQLYSSIVNSKPGPKMDVNLYIIPVDFKS